MNHKPAFATFCLLAAVSVVASGAEPSTAIPQAPEAARPTPVTSKGLPDWIDIFGTTEGRLVQTGFVFVDGRYLPAPYRVARLGVGIYVNNTRLRDKSQAWPSPDAPEDADPGLPPGLGPKSGFTDLDVKGKSSSESWDRKKARWLNQHFPPDEARKRLIQYFRDLPFVAKAELVTRPRALKVTTRSGDVVYVNVSMPLYDPPTKEKVLKEAERIRTRLETRLQEGDCFFFFTDGGELSFGRVKAAEDLGLMVEILSGPRTVSEKIDLLQRMSILPPSTKIFDVLVTNFQPSEQLKDRTAQLTKRNGISPRTLAEIPSEPPCITEARIKEKEFRAKTEARKQ